MVLISDQLVGLLQFALILHVKADIEGDIRLVGSSCHTYLQGRLEIYHSGTWGTICDDLFDYMDALVVCRQLGSSHHTATEYYTAGDGSGTIWMDDVGCVGSETEVKNCGHLGWGSHNCGHHEDVGVRCFQAIEGDLRLIGSFSSGRLEIFHSGSWGTVCDDHFGTTDAQVACKQMKKSYTNAEVYTAGGGNGMIWLDDVTCSGTETRLDVCSHRGWSIENCGHSDDVGIRCYGSSPNNNGDLRLVGGNCPREGRLEVYYGGTWGTVCDDFFEENDARVACRQLGYSTGSAARYTDGSGSGTIWLDDIGCNGNEKRIDSCLHIGWGSHNCVHLEDVGIRCYGENDVNGNWGQWSPWGSCTVTCNSGTRQRSRQCNNPVPSSGGFNCVGSSTDTQNCFERICPVNGGWSLWSTWTTCTIACGGGTQYRSRECNNPVTANGGLVCVGNSTEINLCNTGCCPVDGNWGLWSSWQQCNATCGGGKQSRHRSCNSPAPLFGGAACIGTSSETQDCSTVNCPVNGGWSFWSMWTSCTVPCGGGLQYRSRQCNNPVTANGGLLCIGNSTEMKQCNTGCCPVDGAWGEWSSWQQCNATCGGGKQLRHRSCNSPAPLFGGAACIGTSSETQDCSTVNCPVNGGWSFWSMWTTCTVPCGGGLQYRSRQCNNPVTANGGLPCIGNSTEMKQCNTGCCPVDGAWGEWSSWQQCNATCGGGMQLRHRSCDNPAPLFGGTNCVGIPSEKQDCSTENCPVDGQWGTWSEWSDCSVSCGTGMHIRHRNCNDPAPAYGGSDCGHNYMETDTCNVNLCPINGGWSLWSTWTSCTVSCGGGIQNRSRYCNNPVTSNGGLYCVGNSAEMNHCNMKCCPVDGIWGEWSSWQPCNATCGGGMKLRYRRCDNPVPSFGGPACIGTSSETQYCANENCPVDGQWGTWSEWRDCSASCGTGTKRRHRNCNNPSPEYGGTDCGQNNTDTNFCNIHLCPVDGGWSIWSDWTSCSVSCGGGVKKKTRICSHPTPANGGLYCNGSSEDIRTCNNFCCPVDGHWGTWSPWQNCNSTCGDGRQQRERSCNNPAPGFGGSDCTGIATDSRECSTQNCPVHGNWGSWSRWSDCSTSCDTGTKTRYRYCNDPAPGHGGFHCGQNYTDTDTCHDNPCPVNGGWSLWSDWTPCSMSCGGGIEKRTRTCDNPTPSNGGLHCNGSSEDITICNNMCCPVDGNWGAWSSWDQCNTTYGEGVQNRRRKCDNPPPLFGGLECVGYHYAIQSCNGSDCSVFDAAEDRRIENEATCSIGLLGGIAGGCIIATIVIMVIGQLAFRKLRFSKKDKTQKERLCQVVDPNEVQLRSTQNDYEAPETSACGSNKKGRFDHESGKLQELVSENFQSGNYDRLESAICKNAAFGDDEDRESNVFENWKS